MVEMLRLIDPSSRRSDCVAPASRVPVSSSWRWASEVWTRQGTRYHGADIRWLTRSPTTLTNVPHQLRNLSCVDVDEAVHRNLRGMLHDGVVRPDRGHFSQISLRAR